MTAQALKLRFSADGREQGVEIPVTYTHPHLGGERQWLQCRCGRRCRIIYMGGAGWRCRHCYRLTYQTQREDRSSRAQRQAGKIVRRLGGDDCDWFPNRPRGMHQRTYDRLGERFERQHQIMDDALVERAAALVNRWGPR